MHHTIIYNPAAAQGQAGTRVGEAEAALNAEGLDFTVQMTEGPGHAIELAASLVSGERDGTEVVVAAGGDGTVNEVLNGLMTAGAVHREEPAQSTLPAFGVLCMGRGNDFAYGAGIPTDLAGGVQTLRSGFTAPLDVGYLRGGDYPDGRFFGNGIGVGFDTIVGLEAAKLKRIHGFAAYLVGALKTLLLYYKTPRLRMVMERDPVVRECIQVSIMNGRRLGGAFFMAPEARTGDGEFDLCVAGKPRRGQMLGLLLRYMKGTQAESPHITTGRIRTLSLTAEEGTMAIHADGETISRAATQLEVRCIPGALRVVTRPDDQTNAAVPSGADPA